MLTFTATAATITDAIRPRGVPGHANEERTIVTVVRWPPVLRCRHRRIEVLLERFDVEGLEMLGVVEILFQRIRQVRMRVEHGEIQLVRPPILVGPGPAPLGGRGRIASSLSLTLVVFCLSGTMILLSVGWYCGVT